MNPHWDVAIVGCGIVGAACARTIAESGRRVIALDAGPAGGEASGAAMGHVVVMDDSPAQLALTSYSRQVWQDWRSELPPEAETDPCGTLWVAQSDAEMASVEQKQLALAKVGVVSNVLDAHDLAKQEPLLRPGLAGGLHVCDDFVVYPPVVAAHLLDVAQRHGAVVRLRTPVAKVEPCGTVLLSNGDHVTARRVLVAAGCRSTTLVDGLPLQPRKGHLAITQRYQRPVRHQIIELGYTRSAQSTTATSVACNIQPRQTGQLLIGSSRQYGVTHDKVDWTVLTKMLRRACQFAPDVENLSVVRTWAGFRAAPPDKLPLIGPTRQSDRVWLATGHEGLGVTMATGTARLVRDMLDGRPTKIRCEPFAPSRFQ